MSEIVIIGPDGNRFVFPAGTDRETMRAAMRRRYTGANARTREMIMTSQLPDPELQGVRDYLGREQLTEDIRAGREVAELEAATGPENIAKERFYTAAQGQTLGAAPLLQGAVNVPIAAVMYPFLTAEEKAGRDFGQFVSEMSSLGYDQARGNIARAREKRPLESAGIEIGAGFLTGKTIYDELGKRFLASRAGARGAAVGAGAGGQYGFLEGEGDVGQGLQGAVVGAPLGAGAGKALEAAAEPLGRMFSGLQSSPALQGDISGATAGAIGGGVMPIPSTGDPEQDARNRLAMIGGGAVAGLAGRKVGNAVSPQARAMGAGVPETPQQAITQKTTDQYQGNSVKYIFGNDAKEFTEYGDPATNGVIKVLVRERGNPSIVETLVPEKNRGQGSGKRLLAKALEDHPNLQGQMSSEASVKNAYAAGMRAVSQPDASLDETIRIMREESSVLMRKPSLPPQQAARFETPGSPEYEAAVAKGLDMSTPARMARAKEMGFDTDTVLYHGTPDRRPIDAEGFKTTAERNQQFLMPEARTGEKGPYWFTENRKKAQSYADDSRAFDSQNAEPAVLQVFLRKPSNPLIIDAGGTVFSDIPRDRVLAALSPEALAKIPQNWRRPGGDSFRSDDIVKIARDAGFDGIQIRNVIDDYSGQGRPGNTYATFDPANIRSVNAAFDPDKAASSTLLAAAPFAVGGAGLGVAANQEDR